MGDHRAAGSVGAGGRLACDCRTGRFKIAKTILGFSEDCVVHASTGLLSFVSVTLGPKWTVPVRFVAPLTIFFP